MTRHYTWPDPRSSEQVHGDAKNRSMPWCERVATGNMPAMPPHASKGVAGSGGGGGGLGGGAATVCCSTFAWRELCIDGVPMETSGLGVVVNDELHGSGLAT